MVEPPPAFSARLANRAEREASIAADRRRSGNGLMARIISAGGSTSRTTVAEVREQFVSEIPAGRTGEGKEAAELALATDASDFLAGQVIPISGGWVT
jgi:NAD(P)-dependent dehydrogenase (short-subunit alcohol dehydrogenase family)